MEPELPELSEPPGLRGAAAGAGPAAGNGRPLPWTGTERSYSFPPEVIGQIHEMAEVGRYEIRGWGAKRQMPKSPEVDDTLGWVYYKKNLADLAIPALEDSVNPLVEHVPHPRGPSSSPRGR